MENFQSDFELKNLVQELTQGWEHAKQLQLQLNEQSSSSYETLEFLLQKIMVSYDHALSMLKHNCPGGPAGLEVAASPGVVVKMSDSPRPLSGSPHSYHSDQDFKDKSSGKRMSVQRSTEKVRVCGEAGLIEGQLNDCHSWRKYGQKDILRAKYPREYYRCSHRHSQCCLATKQVQRSDDDPTIFEITYIRKHTCNPPANSSYNLSLAVPDPQNGYPNPLPSVPQQNQHEEQILNIQKSLRVKTPGLETNENPLFNTFCFPSSSSSNPIVNHFFSDGFSPNLMSPATSGSNEFSISPNVVNYDHGGLIPNNSQVFGSELGPIVAAMTFGASSPTVDVHYGSPKLVPDFSLEGKKH